MLLYNIHTHSIPPTGTDGHNVQYVLNTSPEEFYNKKEEHPQAWFSCGIHPWDTDEGYLKMDLMEKIVADKRVVAIGEAGLDKLKGPEMNIQVEVFRQQIELSIRVEKPIIIHCVKAWEELIALHKEYKPETAWIIHGYRGNIEQTRQLARLGFKFSIGEHFNKESIHHIPLDSIFCETDTSPLPICNVYEQVSTNIGIPNKQFALKIEENIKNSLKYLTE